MKWIRHAPNFRLPRGRRSEPLLTVVVWQPPQQPAAPGARQRPVTRRGFRRGRRYDPSFVQDFPLPVYRSKVRLLARMTARGRVGPLPASQEFPNPSKPRRLYLPRTAKARRFFDPPWVTTVVSNPIPPPITRPRVRFQVPTRGRVEPRPAPQEQPRPALPHRLYLPRTARGHRFEPVWPQVPIPDGTPTWRIARAIPRAYRPSRGRFCDPPWTVQPTVVPIIPAVVHPRPRFQTPRRGCFLQLPLQQEVPRTFPTPRRPVPPRPARAKQISLIPAQVPVPVWPATTVRSRLKPALIRRGQGHMTEPVWPQQAQAGSSGLLQRPLVGVGL